VIHEVAEEAKKDSAKLLSLAATFGAATVLATNRCIPELCKTGEAYIARVRCDTPVDSE